MSEVTDEFEIVFSEAVFPEERGRLFEFSGENLDDDGGCEGGDCQGLGLLKVFGGQFLRAGFVQVFGFPLEGAVGFAGLGVFDQPGSFIFVIISLGFSPFCLGLLIEVNQAELSIFTFQLEFGFEVVLVEVDFRGNLVEGIELFLVIDVSALEIKFCFLKFLGL